MSNGLNYTTKEMYDMIQKEFKEIKQDLKDIRKDYKMDHDIITEVEERSSYNRKIIIGAMIAFVVQLAIQFYFNILK